MTITIDELCKRLEVGQNFTPSDYEELGLGEPSLEMKASWYDYNSLPSSRAIAPIVCERLKGAENALELGYGTGFRLLYYALNNPSTQFTAVDIAPQAEFVFKKRMQKLGVRNIHVVTGDMLGEAAYDRESYACIIAIDCLYQPGDTLTTLGVKYLRLGRTVDKRKKPAFFCTQFYDAPGAPWDNRHQGFNASVFDRAGLKRFETVTFSYQEHGGQHRRMNGRLLFASP